jgi:hypothetical protein
MAKKTLEGPAMIDLRRWNRPNGLIRKVIDDEWNIVIVSVPSTNVYAYWWIFMKLSMNIMLLEATTFVLILISSYL